MKTIRNQSPRASERIVAEALAAGIDAHVIERSKPRTRRHHPLGSTASAQKVVSLDGVRMSLGQALQYVAARSKK